MKTFPVLRLGEVDSTNRYALRNLHALRDRQVIVAERQTAGYGRLGRTWVSHVPGNLYMSIVLKPSKQLKNPSALPTLSLYLSVTLCKLLLEYGIEAKIKWPNDVLVDGEKIAGILGEGSFLGDELRGYVLGIGVNLSMDREELAFIDQPATSLGLLMGTVVDRDVFLSRLLWDFSAGYEQFLERGFSMIKQYYMEKCSFLRERIAVTVGGSRYSGIAQSFSDLGALVLRTAEGKVIVMNAGEVEALRTVQ